MEELELLFESWKKKEKHLGKIFNSDGIICEEEWKKQDKKILFILKEAYHRDIKIVSDYDLAGDLRETGPWSTMWYRIAEWAYGMINTTSEHIKPYKKLTRFERKSYVSKVAVMNIKKSDGKSKSNNEDIIQYAEYDAEEILREIEIINPDIIVCGYTIGPLNSALKKMDPTFIPFKSNKETTSENYHYVWKNRIVIDYYHPANRYPALMSYYGLMGCYIDALRNDIIIK